MSVSPHWGQRWVAASPEARSGPGRSVRLTVMPLIPKVVVSLVVTWWVPRFSPMQCVVPILPLQQSSQGPQSWQTEELPCACMHFGSKVLQPFACRLLHTCIKSKSSAVICRHWSSMGSPPQPDAEPRPRLLPLFVAVSTHPAWCAMWGVENGHCGLRRRGRVLRPRGGPAPARRL